MSVHDGVLLIHQERLRQISEENWTAAHDDEHDGGELAMAAVSYATNAVEPAPPDAPPPTTWPWELRWWKPKTPIEDLVRAGALIAAEIDRRVRQDVTPSPADMTALKASLALRRSKDVKTPGELFDALDILHTQVMDNFGDAKSAPYVDILEKAMAALDDLPVGPVEGQP